MKLLISISVVLELILFCHLPRAEAKGAIIGEGAFTCQRYASRPLDKKNDYIIWVQGYVTAYNALSPQTSNVVGNHDYNWVRLWLDGYCQKNPEKKFNDAVSALMEELLKN